MTMTEESKGLQMPQAQSHGYYPTRIAAQRSHVHQQQHRGPGHDINTLLATHLHTATRSYLQLHHCIIGASFHLPFRPEPVTFDRPLSGAGHINAFIEDTCGFLVLFPIFPRAVANLDV